MQVINDKKCEKVVFDAMCTLYSKLDEAIDDMENGRVVSEEELWAELDAL